MNSKVVIWLLCMIWKISMTSWWGHKNERRGFGLASDVCSDEIMSPCLNIWSVTQWFAIYTFSSLTLSHPARKQPHGAPPGNGRFTGALKVITWPQPARCPSPTLPCVFGKCAHDHWSYCPAAETPMCAKDELPAVNISHGLEVIWCFVESCTDCSRWT